MVKLWLQLLTAWAGVQILNQTPDRVVRSCYSFANLIKKQKKDRKKGRSIAPHVKHA